MKDKHVENRGIMGDQVRVEAEVLAVGDNARAIKQESGVTLEEAVAALGQLRAALESVALDEGARTQIRREVEGLDAAMDGPEPDEAEAQGFLQRLVAKVQMAGVALESTAALIEPIKKVAGFLGIGLKLIGL